MKTKCSFILKASIAMILALIMLFGTVATSIAAVVEDDYADTGANVDIADEAADADVAEVAADVDVVDEGADVDLADTAATGDWYIVGNVAGANNWSERDAVKFSAVTGGYSISIQLEKDKDFRLRHNSSDYGAAGSSDSDRKVSNSTTNHSLATGNQTFIWTGTTGTYTVTINSDGSKISFDGTVPGAGGGGGDPEDPEDPEEPEEAGTSSSAVTIDGVSNLTQIYYDFTATGSKDGRISTTNDMNRDYYLSGKRLGFLAPNPQSTWYMTELDISGSWKTVYYSDRGSNNRFILAADGDSATWGTYTDFDSASDNVLEGSDVMFYIQTYADTNKNTMIGLRYGTGDTIDLKYAHKISKAMGYLQIAKTDLTKETNPYKYITNNYNATNWAGTENTNLSGANGGELFKGEGSTPDKVNATTATTTAPAHIAYGTTTLNISTQASSVHSAIGSNLSSQYYIKVGETWHKVGTTYTTSTNDKPISLDISTLDLAAGTTYALKTVLTDGGVYYVADTNTFNVETKHAVTISASPAAGGNVTPASGTAVGESTATTITATPEDGYQFSSWTFGTGITGSSTTANPATITTNSSGDYTVEAVFTAKPTHTITVKTSNSAYGTASASVVNAYEGQSVTLTAAENTGTFQKWKVNTGTVTGVDNDTNKTKTFTMGSTDLVITANFVAYSGTSNFYYNSYGDNGLPAGTHYGARMTQAKLNGEEYSYYHVTGRTESDQLFTVSYESPVYENYNCFFEIYKDWEAGAGVSALFYATDGKNLGGWTGMSFVNDTTSTKKFSIGIPDGARSVRFRSEAGDKNETNELFFTSGSNGWMHNGINFTDVAGYNQSNPVETNFYENFNGENKYTDNWSSGGFSGHNANRGESHAYTKPVTGNGMDFTSNKSDYYILVLYQNKTYTINGVEHKAGTDPEIIWLPTLPVETTGVDYATIYAKDGCINEARGTSRVIGTTEVSGDDVTNVARKTVTGKDNNNASTTIECYTQASAEKGKSITVTTEISSTYASKYVVKGWDVNGTTYGLDSTPTGNTYSVTFTVPDVNKVEITPIYWLKSTYDTTIFFVNNFDKVPSGWGDALYYYYWGGSQVNVNTEERYPGQPFVHEGGQYYAQVPSDVVGVTLNNAVWDTIHGHMIMGKEGSESANHYQTYDYDNFAKIKNEKSALNAIHFTFKYESKKDNFNSNSGGSSITISDFNDTNGNGWENYKDPLGRDNNIFGGTDVSGTGTLYVVSNGYARNYQGNYATEWSIYYAAGDSPTTATLVGTIPSSALVLDDSSDFSNYSDGDYGPYLSTYQTVWSNLKTTYATTPVKITYEQGIYGDKSRINGDGKTPSDSSDYATRIDGKWDYTLDTDYSTAEIKIQYSDDNGLTYTDDTFTSAESNVGPRTEAQAFFTNDDNSPSYEYTHLVTADHHVRVSTTNKYTFKTVPNASTGYKFVGWYRLDASADNPVLIGSDAESASFMSSKATFIARYNKVSSGYLVIAHEVGGAGRATKHTVKAEIYNASDELVNTLEGDSVELDSDYITSDSTYKIKVTLTSIAAANSYIANSVVSSVVVPTIDCSAADDPFYKDPAYTRTVRYAGSIYPVNIVTTVDTFTVKDLYDTEVTTKQNVNVLSYTTTFNKLPTYTINYKYHGRGQTGNDYMTFTRAITLTPDEAEGKLANGDVYTGNDGQALTATYKTSPSDGLVNDITANAPNQHDLQTEVFNKEIEWEVPGSIDPNSTTVTAIENAPEYTLTYIYIDGSGTEQIGTVRAEYNELITLGEKIGETDTFATAETSGSDKFAYWALGNKFGNPLTSTREYKMRLVNDVTIYPVYGNRASGWTAAIDKITRTHQTSDDSDSIFTDFALRFTGFDDNGSFIHINPDHMSKYKVGVAVVYDTEGNNTTQTTAQLDDGSDPFTSLAKYTDAQNVIQTLVNKNLSTAKLSKINATTYVSKFDADNNKLTNFNRIDYALKYNYNTYYKRSYDAYAYIIDTADTSGGANAYGTVIAVSPVKSGYLYDGKQPSGNGN